MYVKWFSMKSYGKSKRVRKLLSTYCMLRRIVFKDIYLSLLLFYLLSSFKPIIFYKID